MNRRLVCVLFQLLLFSSSHSVPSQAQGTEPAKAFVQRVYADYSNPDWRHQEERLERFYTRSLLRLLVADETGHPGEVGNLDWDPICACQDPGDPRDLKVQSISLSATGPLRLKAVVAFTITGGPNTVTLSLLKTSSGWRIDDISERETPSLRAYLKNDHR
jgi:Protein of unknown function (DUF3828)